MTSIAAMVAAYEAERKRWTDVLPNLKRGDWYTDHVESGKRIEGTRADCEAYIREQAMRAAVRGLAGTIKEDEHDFPWSFQQALQAIADGE